MFIFASVFSSIVRGLNDIEFSFGEGRDITVTSYFLGFRDFVGRATLKFFEGHSSFLCGSKYK